MGVSTLGLAEEEERMHEVMVGSPLSGDKKVGGVDKGQSIEHTEDRKEFSVDLSPDSR